MTLILILSETNLCPSSCTHFYAEKSDKLVEYCHLPDGEWILRVEDNELQECPLGKWDLKVAKGVTPSGQ